jgi:V8-like Glu-specific endopeptidase
MKRRFYLLATVIIIGCVMIPQAIVAQEETPKGTAQVCGDTNMIPIMSAPAFWQAKGQPVAKLVIAKSYGTFCCTGFLYSDCCMLTCGHCVWDTATNSVISAKNVRVHFGYEDRTVPYESGYGCNPDVWYACSVYVASPCSVAVIYVDRKSQKGYPGQCPIDKYGTVTFRLTAPIPGENVHVVGHPEGRCKEYSHDDYATVKAYPDPDCDWCWKAGVPPECGASHGADTQGGSSGSPVFDDNGYVIGIHCGADGEDPCKNCFTPIIAVEPYLPTDCTCQAVPALQHWGLIILVTLLVASAAFVMLRRRRVAAAA